MATVLITGGTGTVGKRLTQLLLEKGYQVNILSRGNTTPPEKSTTPALQATPPERRGTGTGINYFNWNLTENYIDPAAITSADYIIHLAGAGVADKRWSKQRKKEIADSRTKSSALIVAALQQNTNQVQAVVSASAIGWYGPDKAAVKGVPGHGKGFEETADCYPDFLGETCRLWEASIAPVTALGKRLVILRTGIVLSNEGGALVEFKKPLLFKTAAILGNGKQMVSWIHIDDLCNQYIYALEHQQMQGIFNAVAPSPVSNKTLTIVLAKKLCGSFYIPFCVPAFVLKIVLGEMSIEILKSTTVSCHKMLATGFSFKYHNIIEAIDELAK